VFKGRFGCLRCLLHLKEKIVHQARNDVNFYQKAFEVLIVTFGTESRANKFSFAHRLVYHSTLGLRVIKKKKKKSSFDVGLWDDTYRGTSLIRNHPPP